MIFFMLRQHQARSAILLSISRKSTVISNYFLNFLSKTQLNQFNQVIVLSEVLIFITADGCAFYSIPQPTQPPFLIFLFGWIFFPQIYPFFCFFIYFLSIMSAGWLDLLDNLFSLSISCHFKGRQSIYSQ